MPSCAPHSSFHCPTYDQDCMSRQYTDILATNLEQRVLAKFERRPRLIRIFILSIVLSESIIINFEKFDERTHRTEKNYPLSCFTVCETSHASTSPVVQC